MSVETLIKISDSLGITVDSLLSDTINLNSDTITKQVAYNCMELSNEEKLFFLNMIKQHKNLK